MVENAFYLVSADIARRSGLINERYRTKRGLYVLDYKDLSRVQFTPEEYISGLQGVEMITAQEAKRLIMENGYKMGESANGGSVSVAVPEPEPENNEATTEEEVPAAEKDVIDTENVGDANDILGNGSEEENNSNEPKEEEE